jgi:predicted Fe-Mo cluster-binding NifX family protein
MGFRVAVASSDGKVVNTHFGKASSFLIFDQMQDESYVLIEKRDVKPVCHGHEHSEDDLQDLLAAISDCQGVLISRIGAEADLALRCQGQEAYIITDYIPSALRILTEYRKSHIHSGL